MEVRERRPRRGWRRVIAVLVFLALGIATIVWLDHTHPAWWEEAWNFTGQSAQTPGSVSINWIDPELVVELDKGKGTWISSGQSPLTAPLNPGLYTVRAKRGDKQLFEEKISIAPGENRVVDLSGFRWEPALAKAPFTAEAAKSHQEEWAEHLRVPVEIVNPIGMKFQ